MKALINMDLRYIIGDTFGQSFFNPSIETL